jgi:hypothetical protein
MYGGIYSKGPNLRVWGESVYLIEKKRQKQLLTEYTKINSERRNLNI